MDKVFWDVSFEIEEDLDLGSDLDSFKEFLDDYESDELIFLENFLFFITFSSWFYFLIIIDLPKIDFSYFFSSFIGFI